MLVYNVTYIIVILYALYICILVLVHGVYEDWPHDWVVVLEDSFEHSLIEVYHPRLGHKQIQPWMGDVPEPHWSQLQLAIVDSIEEARVGDVVCEREPWDEAQLFKQRFQSLSTTERPVSFVSMSKVQTLGWLSEANQYWPQILFKVWAWFHTFHWAIYASNNKY